VDPDICFSSNVGSSKALTLGVLSTHTTYTRLQIVHGSADKAIQQSVLCYSKTFFILGMRQQVSMLLLWPTSCELVPGRSTVWRKSSNLCCMPSSVAEWR